MEKVTLGSGSEEKFPPGGAVRLLPALETLPTSEHLGAIFIKKSGVFIKKGIFPYNLTPN